MTQYLRKSFSIPIGDSAAYRDNYDAVFGKKPAAKRKKRAKLQPEHTPAGCAPAEQTRGYAGEGDEE